MRIKAYAQVFKTIGNLRVVAEMVRDTGIEPVTPTMSMCGKAEQPVTVTVRDSEPSY